MLVELEQELDIQLKIAITEFANCDASGFGKTIEVGKYLPNNWGFHDVHGNVWEWCYDFLEHIKEHKRSIKDQIAESSGSTGGCFNSLKIRFI